MCKPIIICNDKGRATSVVFENKTVSHFDQCLKYVRVHEGDLERHHRNHKLWVTRCSDDEIVMTLDEIEKELTVYFI